MGAKLGIGEHGQGQASFLDAQENLVFGSLERCLWNAQINLSRRLRKEIESEGNNLNLSEMKSKRMTVEEGKRCGISRFPNFHKSGSIRGMKKMYYGMDALLVRCGSFIYNVTSEPSIYNQATI